MPVLIVDDNIVLLQKMARSIARYGYEVSTAIGIRQAREILRTEKITAVCLDLQLPDGHGLDLLEELRAETPDLPVIIMSGANTPEHRDRSGYLGVTAFLTKPFALSHLYTVLEGLSPVFQRCAGRETAPTLSLSRS